MLPLIKIGTIGSITFVNFLLGFFILLRNPKKRINQIFFLVSSFFAFWAACLLLYEFPVIFSSIFWIKATYFAGSAIVVFVLAFSFIFPTTIFRRLWFWAGLSSFLFLGFTIWLLYFTNYWIIDVVIDPDKGLQTLWGPAYFWWLILIWVIFIWALINFIFKYRHLSGMHRVQLKYLFFGFGLWAVLLNIPDVLIPVLFNDTRFFSISPISNLVFNFSIAYIILKHRFMDIRLVVARSVTYALLILAIGIFYAGGLFALGSFVTREPTTSLNLITSTILALIVAFSFQPLRHFFEKLTDKYLYRAAYRTDELLGILSKAMGSTLTLNTLTHKILDILTGQMKVTKAALVLKQKGELNVIESNHGEQFFKITPQQYQRLSYEAQLLVFEELEEGELKKYFREMQISVVLPLNTKDHFIGFLILGEKASGDIYFDKDIKTLEIMGPELAVALQNAERYEEIKQFSEKLEMEVKKATMDLEVANKRLKDLDKLKDEFISVVAHELRSPLTAIKGYISMIVEGDVGDIPEKARGFLVDANAINERVIRLVNNMLNVSRIEEGRMVYQVEVENLSQVARTVFSQFRSEAERKGLEFSLVIPREIRDRVRVDPDRIHEVVANLLSNAIKYTEKGSIIVKLSQPDPDTVRLGVVDTGPGISQEEQKVLFKKFSRGTSTIGKTIGTGLGLYICKLLVDKFNGQLGLKSEVDKGSTFWFELPLVDNEPTAEKVSTSTS